MDSDVDERFDAQRDAAFATACAAWAPPARLSLSEWADDYFVLSPETAAEPGRFSTLPYQRGILDAITDPDITFVTLKKSSRLGYTIMVSAAIGYYIHHEPTTMLVVQPTIPDAEGFSKETIAPMLRDVPVLSKIVFGELEERPRGPRASSATMRHKTFPGGVLSLAGANSGTDFRRISRRVILFDEVDAYPLSAGNEGDPILLGIKRSEYFWNRKVVAGSTPLIEGTSRISEMYEAGDRRRYYVPCPHCDHMDFFRFSERDDDIEGGHLMDWSEGPEKACFMCRACGCAIEETHKLDMLEKGEWRAHGEFAGHASFHIWAAYSLSPNATWAAIVREFLDAKNDPAKLQVFVNTTLAQTWKERGEAPEWERLHDRREFYELRIAPKQTIVVTVGVDVQQDRFVWEAVAWGERKESWSIAIGEIYGDTADDATWAKLDELLAMTFAGAEGTTWPIAMLAIDSSYRTQHVYDWARQKPMTKVIACKGVSGQKQLVGIPSSVEINHKGKRMQRGYKVWPTGVDIAKEELYGWLKLRIVDGIVPTGYCHFPDHPQEFFKQLTAEILVKTVHKRTRKVKFEWHVLPNRQNHFLDTRILARVAASVQGIDQVVAPPPPPTPTLDPANAETPRSGWLGGGGSSPRGGWLKRVDVDHGELGALDVLTINVIRPAEAEHVGEGGRNGHFQGRDRGHRESRNGSHGEGG
jgi:phage terminase large subunit GpA-like protein